MIRLSVRHETIYLFENGVVLGPHQLMLRPREGPDLRIESASLTIDPVAAVSWSRDPFDNAVATVTFEVGRTKKLRILNEVIVNKFDVAPLDFVLNDDAAYFPFAYEPEHAEVFTPFFANVSTSSRLAAKSWAAGVLGSTDQIQTFDALARLCQAIKTNFIYYVREEPGVQSVEQTLHNSSGSCRDFATLLIEAVRAFGLAARFVSGYRYEPALPLELGATHAWAEVFLPGAGWKGFDPTIGSLADWHHVATAVARSPTDAPPVSGVFTGGPTGSTLRVSVAVTEL